MSRPLSIEPARVVALVTDAIELGLPPHLTVAAILDITPNQARHQVNLAKAAGLLGRRPHRPARALLHRGTRREKSWLVCETCTTHWPCPQAFSRSSRAAADRHDPADTDTTQTGSDHDGPP